MRPVDAQQIGEELAIKWEDGSESFITLQTLRRACPCAGCQGERDVMGNLYKGPDRPLTPAALRLVRLGRVGTYALQPVWANGAYIVPKTLRDSRLRRGVWSAV
jgi:DUF971 family protein